MIPTYRVSQGLWIADAIRPYVGEFDYVLALTLITPATDEGLHHKHLAPVGDPQEVLDRATTWIAPRWQSPWSLLVQSEAAHWAEAAVAATFVHLGATPDEAIEALRSARPEALSDQRLVLLLRARGGRHVR